MIEPGPVVPQLPTAPSEPVPGQGTGSDLLPMDTLDDNVRGRPLTPPEAGFGKLWRKRYWVRLPGVDMTPEALVQYWRTEFGHVWPTGNAFYRPVNGLEEGEVALFDLSMPLGARLSTGVVVVDVEPTSFAFQTSRGHTFAGRITFSARDDDGVLVAQVESEIRASDPLYELGLPIGGHAREDGFWMQTLRNLAAHLGLTAEPEMTMTQLDGHRKWRNAANIRDNAFLHTAATMLVRPFRFALARLGAKGGPS
jgi:hypothetical protein